MLGTKVDSRIEFDRQVGSLVRNGYPALGGLDEEAFLRLVMPLGESLPDASVGSADWRIPFVVVVGSELAPPDRAIGFVTDARR